jgi:hypothetical protein
MLALLQIGCFLQQSIVRQHWLFEDLAEIRMGLFDSSHRQQQLDR